jgi:CRISPR-associated protein Cmr1
MSKTKVLNVTLGTVTPLFLGGADPRGSPELRGSSLRGAMRYWLRALLGAHRGDDFAAVNQAESAVFGNTNKASPVILRVKGRPHYADLERRSRVSGYNYLYWSLFLQHRDRNPRCIAPGSIFEVSLGLRPGIHQDQVLWQAGAALWLTVRLGGLGTRSRRTLGSLTAREETALVSPLPPFVSAADDPTALVTELEVGLRRLHSIVNNDRGQPSRKFNVLHEDRCSIWVVGESQLWPTWEDAAERMGTVLREFRQGFPLHKRASLGLPLKGLEKRPCERYASPLILTVAPLRKRGFVGIVVIFEPLIGSIGNFKDSLVRPFVESFGIKKEVAL